MLGMQAQVSHVLTMQRPGGSEVCQQSSILSNDACGICTDGPAQSRGSSSKGTVLSRQVSPVAMRVGSQPRCSAIGSQDTPQPIAPNRRRVSGRLSSGQRHGCASACGSHGWITSRQQLDRSRASGSRGCRRAVGEVVAAHPVRGVACTLYCSTSSYQRCLWL